MPPSRDAQEGQTDFKIRPLTATTWRPLALRIFFAILVCSLVGYATREAVLTRQLATLSEQSRHRAELYRLSLESLIARNGSLPRIIALEPRLHALLSNPHAPKALLAANEYLQNLTLHADLSAAFVMDNTGLTIAASNYWAPANYVGSNYGFRPYFTKALQGELGTFYGIGATTGEPGYFLAAAIEEELQPQGVVVVKIGLENFEAAMIRSGDTVALTDQYGIIFLSSVHAWKYHPIAPLSAETLDILKVSRQYDQRLLAPLGIKLNPSAETQRVRAAIAQEASKDYLVQTTATGPLGWKIVLFTDTAQEYLTALFAGIAASCAAALLFSFVIYFRLNLKRYQERREAQIALKKAHRILEKRIAERTAALTCANDALHDKFAALKATERILRETQDNAVQAGKLAVLGQMAAGISHEVNQPLTAIHTFTDNAATFLELGELAEAKENLSLIKQMAQRIGNIVGEIKNFSRRPTGEREKTSITLIVSQALMLVEPKRRQLQALIVDQTEGSENVFALANPQRLEQVLVNLLLNALDATAEQIDKRISIGIRQTGATIGIVVSDNGHGIPDEVFPHLFEPFYTTKPSGQGLGLGLSISRMIVEEFGGELSAQKLETGGAQFTITLESA